jgi:hypothetical protein
VDVLGVQSGHIQFNDPLALDAVGGSTAKSSNPIAYIFMKPESKTAEYNDSQQSDSDERSMYTTFTSGSLKSSTGMKASLLKDVPFVWVCSLRGGGNGGERRKQRCQKNSSHNQFKSSFFWPAQGPVVHAGYLLNLGQTPIDPVASL